MLRLVSNTAVGAIACFGLVSGVTFLGLVGGMTWISLQVCI